MRTIRFSLVVLLSFGSSTVLGQDNEEKALSGFGLPYRDVALLHNELFRLKGTTEEKIEKLRKQMPDSSTGDLRSKLALARQLVQLSDEAARKARIIEMDYERAYLFSPPSISRETFKNNFYDILKDVNRLREHMRKYQYYVFTVHRYPSERSSHTKTHLNQMASRFLWTLFDGEKDTAKFSYAMARWEILFAEYWETLVAVAKEVTAKKK